jgi:hypothetical protein
MSRGMMPQVGTSVMIPEVRTSVSRFRVKGLWSRLSVPEVKCVRVTRGLQ